MTDEQHKYLIDTDVFAHIHNRDDSTHIYSEVIALAQADRAKTVRQVFDELKRHKKQHAILSPHKDSFVLPALQQYVDAVQDGLEKLGNEASYLWEQTGGKNPDPADPWLIAVAAVYDFTLVTDESATSTKRIPAACKIPGVQCRCISGPHFIFETGIITEILREQISVHAFFETSK